MPRTITDVKREVWCTHEELCWQKGEVGVIDGEQVTLYIPESDEVRSAVPISQICEVDETHEANLDNVTDMNNLHEAPLLYLLRRRLEQRTIYTWAGSVLVSVNPYSADLGVACLTRYGFRG